MADAHSNISKSNEDAASEESPPTSPNRRTWRPQLAHTLITAPVTAVDDGMGPTDHDGHAEPAQSRPIRPFSSSFPPHHPSYQPIPRSDSPSQRTAYSERQERPYDDDRDPEGEVGYAVDGPDRKSVV